jgi:hypothetical protein
VLAAHCRAWVDDVGQHHRGAEENIVFANDPFVEGDVVLNLNVVADDHAVGDEYVLPQTTVFSYARTGHNVAEVPDFGVAPDLGAFVNEGRGMGEIRF